MKRKADTRKIKDLRSQYIEIEFPDYQREPSVWKREQKQRLIDSILRRFDISAIYLYQRDEDSGVECIDGRQRLNAIMSFLGDNESDEDDNGFRIHIENEVAEHPDDDLKPLEGLTFEQLEKEHEDVAKEILDYKVTTVMLSGSREPDEFNLQFLRLNLGTLINAGEKLHAMVGVMRDLIFEDEDKRLGKHPFLQRVGVPTRRYARELIAAQLMLQVSSKSSPDGADPEREFTRARHFDLQRYVKQHAQEEDAHVDQLTAALNVMEEHASDVGQSLSNRAICVSVVLAAWELKAAEDSALADEYGRFLKDFLEALKEHVKHMRNFSVEERFDYLTEFQRHLTQASVEKPAVTYRHNTLLSEFATWRSTGGKLTGQA